MSKPLYPILELNLPITVHYDDLNRHVDHFNNLSMDYEFLDFVKNMESLLDNLKNKEKETQPTKSTAIRKLKTDYESKLGIAEKKMADFRILFANKIKSIEKLGNEKERAEKRLKSAQMLIKSFQNNSSIGRDEKERLSHLFSILEGVEYHRAGIADENTKRNRNGSLSPGYGLDGISEAETTDLSMTHSEEDFLDLSYIHGTRARRATAATKRRSNDLLEQKNQQGHGKKVRKSGSGVKHPEYKSDQIPARAVLDSEKAFITPSFPEPVPQLIEPSAPAEIPSDPEVIERAYNTRSSFTKPPQGIELIYNASPARCSRALSITSMAQNPHSFVTKTIIKPETCEPCGKRIRFSKEVLKCRDCKASCHPECRDKVPLPCVSALTPRKNKKEGAHLADYCPQTHPMVPSLIQHCVNWIELNGSKTIGLYRIPGSEKAVHELKERFLKGKGVPNLDKYKNEVPTVCGCVKDFLRSTISEQLIGRWSWKELALALEVNDPIKINSEITRTLNELPPPNQDTLAFLILHLQRIAQFPEVKMPLENLTKIFGPTIIGYSKDNLSPGEMLKETKTQQHILETLLSISSEFWENFLIRSNNLVSDSNSARAGTLRSSFRINFGSGGCSTPTQASGTGSVGRNGKKIYFSDVSPIKDSPGPSGTTKKQNKGYFD